jgi:hypothetical protein
MKFGEKQTLPNLATVPTAVFKAKVPGRNHEIVSGTFDDRLLWWLQLLCFGQC